MHRLQSPLKGEGGQPAQRLKHQAQSSGGTVIKPAPAPRGSSRSPDLVEPRLNFNDPLLLRQKKSTSSSNNAASAGIFLLAQGAANSVPASQTLYGTLTQQQYSQQLPHAPDDPEPVRAKPRMKFGEKASVSELRSPEKASSAGGPQGMRTTASQFGAVGGQSLLLKKASSIEEGDFHKVNPLVTQQINEVQRCVLLRVEDVNVLKILMERKQRRLKAQLSVIENLLNDIESKEHQRVVK